MKNITFCIKGNLLSYEQRRGTMVEKNVVILGTVENYLLHWMLRRITR